MQSVTNISWQLKHAQVSNFGWFFLSLVVAGGEGEPHQTLRRE